MTSSKETYKKFVDHMQRLADVQFASAILQWDQETYMPEKGAEMRARQLATLTGLAHKAGTDAQLGEWLKELKNAGLNEDESVNVHHASRDYSIRNKYSTEFVEKMSRTVSASFQAWHEAKSKNQFSVFEPHLQQLLELKYEECELLGYKNHPYDALLDQFEPGLTVAQLNPVFEGIKNNLKPVIDQIIAKGGNVRDDFMFRKFDVQKQWDFGRDILKQMGYDFTAGRQDKSAHPFTIHFNAHDVRVTTRIDQNNLHEMIWSCIHEGGHALYEQGMRTEFYGLALAEAVSLGIHESQSRLWENSVGRSKPYWECNYPLLQKYFPDQLKDVTCDEFYRAMNKVVPSLIRTNADELTYHFHVLIRYEIERQLFEQKLTVKDLPDYWNARYKEYLGIDVPSDTKGVLQDVHWSHGSFGYFPTYSLGSFYAAQFFETATQKINGLESEIRKGNLSVLLKWLRQEIHTHGKRYTANELCTKITGRTLDPSAFIAYAKNKYGAMLGISWK